MNKYLYKIKDLEIPTHLKYWFARKSKVNFDLSEILNGTSFDLTNTVNKKLHLINIFGNSIQNGEATPENPIEIKSSGDNGSINEIISENLNAVILPEEYQQVEYIESTGTQYIDTRIKASSNVSLEITGRLINLENGSNLTGVVSAGFVSYLQLLVLNNYYAARFIYDNVVSGNYNRISDISYLDDKFHKFKLSHKNGFYIDNNKIGDGSNYNYQLDFTIPLFGYRNTSDNLVNVSNSRISEFKQFSNENNKILLKHLIPCYRKLDGVIGMYDIINDEFFTNAGTGTFVVGNEIISQTYTIPCQQTMRAIGDVKDTFVKIDEVWYERHIIEKGVLGTENYRVATCWEAPDKPTADSFNTAFFGIIIPYTALNTNFLSNRFIYTGENYWASDKEGLQLTMTDNRFRMRIEKNKLVGYDNDLNNTQKCRLLSDYLNNNLTEVLYSRVEPLDLPCTQEQITALEQLQKAKTYKDVTHIYTDDEVPANLEIQYYKEKEEE